jgi:predicted amidohydrolase YtcJ
MHKRIWQNCHAATMVGGTYSIIEDAAIVTVGERIDWIGPHSEILAQQGAEIIDLGGAWVTPGLIDCHTHTVFGGNRSGEFEQRLQGVSGRWRHRQHRAGHPCGQRGPVVRQCPAASGCATPRRRDNGGDQIRLRP